MARKFDEAANFVFVQLIEQEPGIYDKRHTDHARRHKIDLAWEKFLMRRRSLDPGKVPSKEYKRRSLNCNRRKDAPQVFFS
jgi:hypothetical protein